MPFVKGQSGNPSGKAKDRPSFRATLERRLVQSSAKLDESVGKLLESAATGEAWAIKELADRLDGKPAQAIVGAAPDGSHKVRHDVVITIVDPKN